MSARIVVACGSGIGTSKAVAKKLSQLLHQRGLDVEVIATEDADIDQKLEGACAYVPLVEPSREYDVPIVVGYPFLVGIDEEEALEELVRIIKDANQ